MLPLLSTRTRVPVIGTVAHGNDQAAPPAGPDRLPWLLRQALARRLRLEGLIVWDHAPLEPELRREVAGWLKEGRIRYREDVAEGLERAPLALIGLLQGRELGKQRSSW